jgi:hypothetical protein
VNVIGELCIPFEQVPQGAFFRLVPIPEKRWQKLRDGISVDDAYKMIVFKADAPCVVESDEDARCTT